MLFVLSRWGFSALNGKCVKQRLPWGQQQISRGSCLGASLCLLSSAEWKKKSKKKLNRQKLNRQKLCSWGPLGAAEPGGLFKKILLIKIIIKINK